MDDFVRRLKDLSGLGPLVGFPTGGQAGFGVSYEIVYRPAPLSMGDAAPGIVGERSINAGNVDAASVRESTPAATRSARSDKGAETNPAPKSPRRERRKRQSNAADSPTQFAAPEPKRALTIDEAVRLYSISRSSLYKLIKSGQLPHVKVAGRRLIPRDAMEHLISGVRS